MVDTAATAPDLFQILHLPADVTSLPAPVDPYYVISHEGTYVHKRTALGTALVPIDGMPDNLRKMPETHRNGRFTFEAPRLPAGIVSQIFTYFEQVYDNWTSEAEVILTYKPDADPPYRVFVPWQRVSAAHVYSIFNPTNIADGWQLVGTVHSHANFGAGHSGTDTSDGSKFPGIHLTFGNVKDAQPSFAAMAMFNGKQYHFDPNDLADLSNVRDGTFPNFWMRYVIRDEATATKVASKLETIVPKTEIDRFLGKTVTTVFKPTVNYNNYGYQYDFDHWGDWGKHGAWTPSSAAKTKTKVASVPDFEWNDEFEMFVLSDYITPVGTFTSDTTLLESLQDHLDNLTTTLRDYKYTLTYQITDLNGKVPSKDPQP